MLWAVEVCNILGSCQVQRCRRLSTATLSTFTLFHFLLIVIISSSPSLLLLIYSTYFFTILSSISSLILCPLLHLSFYPLYLHFTPSFSPSVLPLKKYSNNPPYSPSSVSFFLLFYASVSSFLPRGREMSRRLIRTHRNLTCVTTRILLRIFFCFTSRSTLA